MREIGLQLANHSFLQVITNNSLSQRDSKNQFPAN